MHDWDLANNGLYGQHTGSANLDRVEMGADVGVGRAPVATAAEAGAFVNKVLAYEMLRRPEDGTPWT